MLLSHSFGNKFVHRRVNAQLYRCHNKFTLSDVCGSFINFFPGNSLLYTLDSSMAFSWAFPITFHLHHTCVLLLSLWPSSILLVKKAQHLNIGVLCLLLTLVSPLMVRRFYFLCIIIARVTQRVFSCHVSSKSLLDFTYQLIIDSCHELFLGLLTLYVYLLIWH